MSDSIQNVIRTIEKASGDGIDLINKVDSFYNSAWDKLIIIGYIAFAVIGIIVPFVIQWYQKKSLKISEELLKKEIENHTLKLKTELLTNINEQLESKLKVFENKILRLTSSMNAKIFHIQGNIHCINGDLSSGFIDFINAAQDYLICEDYYNLQVIFNNISTLCLKELTYEQVLDIKLTHNCDIEVLLSAVSKKNEKGIFSPMLKDIRLKLNNLKKDINDKPIATENS
jgi:hypothetical protein